MRRTNALLLTAALALGTLVPRATADDGERAAIVDAVGDVLHGADAATRQRARELLRQNPDAAVGVLLQALEELAAARRPPVAVATVTDSVAAAPPAPAGEGEGEPLVRTYDVRDLVAGAGAGAPGAVVKRVRALLTDGGSVTPQGDGVLVVKAAPRTLDDIERALTALRQGATEIVHIGARIVAAPFTAPLGREVSAARPGEAIALDDPAAALARWIAAGDARVVTAPALACFSGQRASVQVGCQISFVADFDVEVGQSSFIADPIIDTIWAGVEVALVPTTHGDGRVTVDVDASATDVDFDTFATTLGAQGVPVEIQIPALLRTEVRRSIDVADGDTIVLRLGDDRDERRLLMLTVTREAFADDE